MPGPTLPTVLVVDDEPDMLRLIEAILGEQGFNVLPAKGADAAIRVFEKLQHKPDLILTDVVMPGMSGPMLIDHLLSLQPDIRVLFMSGYDDRQVVQRYVVEKGFSLIAKPFTVQRLGAAVKDLLEGRQPDQPSPLIASPMETARRWYVSGRVQGVGYRWFVQKHAAELGVTGWVRNEDDGRVQVYAVGSHDKLNDLAGFLHRGPRMADVRGVEEQEAAMQQLSSFQSH